MDTPSSDKPVMELYAPQRMGWVAEVGGAKQQEKGA